MKITEEFKHFGTLFEHICDDGEMPYLIWHWWVVYLLKQKLGDFLETNSAILVLFFTELVPHTQNFSENEHQDGSITFLTLPALLCGKIWLTEIWFQKFFKYNNLKFVASILDVFLPFILTPINESNGRCL